MHTTSVFVSSTCYDLKALREHLKSSITAIGHDPILSEYTSFPVSPELSSVENCKKVVRDRADLFVLIVGGKRGSLDPVSQRSVINAEYWEAKKAGLDCFVFVDRQVWDLLPHYKKNPEADFTPTVDNPGVFDFLDELISDTKWIYQFQRTDEIIQTLTTQLSIRLQDLLRRVREGRLAVPSEFRGESSSAIDLVLNKGPLWEYRLAAELLSDRMSRIDSKFMDITQGFAFRRTKFLPVRHTINHIQDLLADITTVLNAATRVVTQEIAGGFGPKGEPGNAAQIKRGCDNLYAILITLYEWELDVRFVRPHELFVDIFKTMHGWSAELLTEFHRLPRELNTLLAQSELTGEHSINLVFKSPAGLKDFIAAFEKLSNDPQVLVELAAGA